MFNTVGTLGAGPIGRHITVNNGRRTTGSLRIMFLNDRMPEGGPTSRT